MKQDGVSKSLTGSGEGTVNSPDRPSIQRELAIPLLLGLVQLVLLSTGGADPFHDDSYISLRYADNLVAGNGLVFNVGERVEGFTNPLWTLLGAAFIGLGLAPVVGLKIAGATCFLGLICSGWYAAAEAGLDSRGRQVVALLLATTAVLPYWSLSGLETVPFAWAALVGVRRYAATIRAGNAASLSGAAALAVATLLRPEAAAFVVLVGSATLAVCLRRGGGIGALRRVAASAGIYLLPVGGWQWIRLSYYGEWLPNTFYAKVSDAPGVLARGLEYLVQGLQETPLIPLLLGIALWPIVVKRPLAGLAALVAFFHVTWVVFVGGDFMGLSRFFVPALPLLVVAWAPAVAPRRRLFVATAALAGVLGLSPYVTQDIHREPDPHLRRYERAARWIDRNTPEDVLIASTGIGVIGFVSGRRILDTNGLIDKEIARFRTTAFTIRGPAGHDRAHPDYVLARRPDMILLANIWVRPDPMSPESLQLNEHLLFATERFLFGKPEFLQRYDIVNWPMDDGGFFAAAVRSDSPAHPDHPEYSGPAPGPIFGR
jgi:hypothetical protein